MALEVGRVIPHGSRVLDVGCARGANAELLRARGATHLAGIERDEEFAAEARERYDEVVQGSVPEDLPWPPESFDTVLCYDVVEHLYGLALRGNWWYDPCQLRPAGQGWR